MQLLNKPLNMKLSINKADITKLSVDERNKMYAACESFNGSSGEEIFFEHLNNLWISSILGLNKVRHDSAATLITDDYFRWGLEAINFVKDQIAEYAQAKDLNKPNKAQ